MVALFGLALVLGVFLMSVLFMILFWVFNTPYRRWSRTAIVLDVVEEALASREDLPAAMARLTHFPDFSAGFRFPRRIRRLAGGDDLIGALSDGFPILPDNVTAILEAGLETDDVSRVLPLCRRSLQGDRHSRTRGLLAWYPMFFGLSSRGLFSPMPVLAGATMAGFMIFIRPRFARMINEMTGYSALPPITDWVLHSSFPFFIVGLLSIVPACLLIGYLLRDWPYLPGLLSNATGAWLDRLIPWWRWRCQRDFSYLLAMLLDAGVPEPKALRLAAAGSGNGAYRMRAERAVDLLSTGVPLPDVLRDFVRDREFGWRWNHVLHTEGAFLPAIQGWLDYLDARAFRVEQAFNHILSTLIYASWAALIGLFVCGIVRGLMEITIRLTS